MHPILRCALSCTLLFTVSVPGHAQQPSNQWQAVEALKPGSNVRIKLADKRVMCAFDSASDDTLICHRREAGVDRSMSIPRSDIRLIRARNMTGSIIVGTVVGAGIGLGIGAIVDSAIKNPNTTDYAKFERGLAPVGGLLGAFFGLATQFMPGKLLYKP